MADLTAFGKAVRKLRIDGGVSMMDLADALNCSPAFVSSVETGRKAAPDGFVEQVARFFKLDRKGTGEIQKLALQSRNVVRLRPNPQNREVVAEFARKFDSLGKEQMQEILGILNKVRGK